MIAQRVVERSNMRHKAKIGLAACGLTCRHWARMIRPILFRELTLRNPNDVLSLLEFLNPLSVSYGRWHMREHVRTITYVVSHDHLPPWTRLHMLSRNLSRAKITLAVQGSYGVNGTSLLKSYPRTLPPSVFPFHNVHIQDVEFYDLSEFAPLFQNKLKLLRGSCSGLTISNFAGPGPTQISRYSPRFPRQTRTECLIDFIHVNAKDATRRPDILDQLRLMSRLFLPAQRLELDRNSWDAILELLGVLIPHRFLLLSLGVEKEKGSQVSGVCDMVTAHHFRRCAAAKGFIYSLLFTRGF